MKTTTASKALLTIVVALAASACGSSNHNSATNRTNAPSTITSIERQTTAAARVPRPTHLVDKSVRIKRGRLHLHCNGHGASTVLLIAGWDNSGDEGWSPVQPTIARQTRVCSYDRFGTGTSDAATTQQTFTTQAADLHELLEKAGEPGPYVVVGHSFGGAAAVTFAANYGDEVTGLMLIDASPATWPAALCAVPHDGSPAARDYETTCAVFHHPQHDAERLDAFPAFDAVAKIDTLGHLPLTVMTAARRTLPGLGAPEIARLTKVWDEGVARWAALSTDSKVVSVDNTGHHIQGDRPKVVINEVMKLIPQESGTQKRSTT